MNTIRKSLLFLAVFAALVLFAVPAFAAETTITITESQVNEAYWVTNPPWRAVSDVSVDFQPGQVVVNGTITPRRGDSVAVAVVLTPTVTNGRVTWTATTVTRDGVTVSDDLLERLNNRVSSTWGRYWKTHRQPGQVTAVEVGKDTITITLASRR